MRFLSNFGCKIIFMPSVNFWHQQDSNLLFKRKHWSRDLLVQVAYYSLCSVAVDLNQSRHQLLL